MRHLDPQNLESIQNILATPLGESWATKKIVQTEDFDSGNMNLSLRLHFAGGETLFCKQGRPWVEKYPDVAAPVGRTSFEGWFLDKLAGSSVAEDIPTIVGRSDEDQILILEDLGSTRDGIYLYENAIKKDFAAPLVFLAKLHAFELEDLVVPFSNNLAMRQLNAFHMYEFPFGKDSAKFLEDNLQELTPLHTKVMDFAAKNNFASDLKEHYLTGATKDSRLLHGDFYPGSWIYQTSGRFVCIDPEFGFLGPREFDVGVLIGHAMFCGIKIEPDDLHPYIAAHPETNIQLAYRFAGCEILRRLFGLAQLPLQTDVDQKASWTETAFSWLV